MISIAKKPKILVIGDIILDHYLWGKCERISPEAPVQVVAGEKENFILGGAGNVLNNLLALGAEADLYAVIAEDTAGRILKELLEAKTVSAKNLITESGRITTKKSRIMAQGQQLVRIDKESSEPISSDTEADLFSSIKKSLYRYDMLLLSDYAKGVLTPTLTQKLIYTAKQLDIPVLVDPKGDDFSKYKGATLITPNKKEAVAATKMALDNKEQILHTGMHLKEMLSLKYALITLSEEGMAVFSDRMEHIKTKAHEIYDVTGAGDTVIAALAFALATGNDIFSAAHFANSAAAVVVSKVGSATATIEEILAYEKQFSTHTLSSKIVTPQKLVQLLQNRHQKVVFTNGCFDILHAGHVRYLHEAAKLGDIFIVGVNSDDSVRRLKGKERPLNTWEDRAIILAALESVDFVVGFEEDTPYELIKQIRPDILVKGGDYEGKEIVGSDIAKETRTIDFVDNRSTTALIDKIQTHKNT